MNKFKLTTVDNYPGFIYAPEWCPYKTALFSYPEWDKNLRTLVRRKEKDSVVSASLCPLCRQCSFVVEGTIDTSDVTSEERSLFVNYLTQVNTRASTTLSAQLAFLGRSDKLPLGVLISPTLFDDMLAHIFVNNEERFQKIREFFFRTEEPICHLVGNPVYVSRKLTRSYLQVIGEVEWK